MAKGALMSTRSCRGGEGQGWVGRGDRKLPHDTMPLAPPMQYVEKAATDTIRYKTEMDEGGFWEKEKEMRMAEAEKVGDPAHVISHLVTHRTTHRTTHRLPHLAAQPPRQLRRPLAYLISRTCGM